MDIKEAFVFDKMLTPKIITFVYWLLLFFSVVGGISTISVTGRYGGASGLSSLMGIGIIVGGVVGARIFCELLIVLFKIHENIKKLADRQA